MYRSSALHTVLFLLAASAESEAFDTSQQSLQCAAEESTQIRAALAADDQHEDFSLLQLRRDYLLQKPPHRLPRKEAVTRVEASQQTRLKLSRLLTESIPAVLPVARRLSLATRGACLLLVLGLLALVACWACSATLQRDGRRAIEEVSGSSVLAVHSSDVEAGEKDVASAPAQLLASCHSSPLSTVVERAKLAAEVPPQQEAAVEETEQPRTARRIKGAEAKKELQKAPEPNELPEGLQRWLPDKVPDSDADTEDELEETKSATEPCIDEEQELQVEKGHDAEVPGPVPAG